MPNFIEILANQRDGLKERNYSHMIYREPVDSIDLKSPCAQVVIGLRRSGKSVLCHMALAKNPAFAYGYVNFDDEHLRNVKAENLNEILEAAYAVYGDFSVLFLDEIQNVAGWELFVNRMLRQGLHLLVTGSNSKLLSSELATHLTGRHMVTELFPFSFCEYRRYMKRKSTSSTKEKAILRRDYEKYYENGGLPETFLMDDVRGYISMLYASIIHQDIVRRHRIRNIEALERVAYCAMESYAQEISYENIASRLGISNIRTVQNYVRYLEDAYLMRTLNCYSAKPALRTKIGKVYATDQGFISYFTSFSRGPEHLGRRLENLVYLELLRHGRKEDYQLFYYNDSRHEVDFVIVRLGHVVGLVQVAYDIENPKTRQRELMALAYAGEKLGCSSLVLITDHQSGEEMFEGHKIKILDAPNWLENGCQKLY